jgi:hypothetical protein
MVDLGVQNKALEAQIQALKEELGVEAENSAHAKKGDFRSSLYKKDNALE